MPEKNKINFFYKCFVSVFFGFLIFGIFLSVANADTYWAYREKINYAFGKPHRIVIDATDNVYVLDQGNYNVTKFSSAGNLLCSVGSQGTGDGQFSEEPKNIAIDSTGQYFYVVEGNAVHRVQKFNASNCAYAGQFGSWGGCDPLVDETFCFPDAITVDVSGNIYVADGSVSSRVQKFSSAGTFLSKWTPTSRVNNLTYAESYFYTTQGGNFANIAKYNLSGTFQSQFGTYGVGEGQIYDGEQLAIDSSGYIYEADGWGARVQIFDNNGNFITKIGGEYNSTADGEFSNVEGIALDSNGDIYIADPNGGARVQKFSTTEYKTPAMVDSIVLGHGSIGQPSVAMDFAGNLHVAYRGDTSNQLKYAKWNGVFWSIDTIEGNNSICSHSLSIDSQGNPHIAYYSDSWNVLKYAKWTGISWSTHTIDADCARKHVSIAIDGADNPHIAYGEGPLKYAKYNGVSWSTYTITGTCVFATQIALSSKSEPYIAYSDYFTKDIVLATWNGSGFDSSVITPTNGTYFKFVLDGYNYPHFVYASGGSKYIRWDGNNWTSPEAILSYAYDPKSFQLDGNSVPHVYYYTGASGGLYHAFKSGASWISEIVDVANAAGFDVSVAFDSSGKQQIVYKGGVDGLKLLFSQWTGTGYPLALGGNNRGKLQMPSSFQGVRTGKNINWTWTDNSSNEIGFKIYGSTISSGPFGLIDDSISAGVTSNDETSLAEDTTYYRYAVAYNEGGFVTSNLSSVYIPAFTTALNPSFSDITDTSLTASWDNITSADYVVALFTDSDYTNVVAGSSVTQSGISKTFTGLVANTSYYFQVKLSTETDIAFSLNKISIITLFSPPVISSIAPSSGTINSSVDITNLEGTGFRDGVTVKLTKAEQSDIAATDITVVSAVKITCTLPLTGAATGLWNIVITNSDAQLGQLTNGFTVNNVPPAPTAITPNLSGNDGSVNITNLAGTGFQIGATVKLTKDGEFDIDATDVNVASTLKITCTIPLSGATTGLWNVVVTNPDAQGDTFSNGFTVTLPGPAVTSIEPSSSFAKNPVSIIVNGTNFYSGATVKLEKTGQTDINGTSVNVINPNKLTCDFNLLGAISGQWDITVTVPGNSPAQLLNAFTIMAPAVEQMKIYQGVFDPAQGKKSYITTKIASPGKVTVKVYDSMGRFIRTLFEGDRNAGDYSDEWNGKNKDGSTVASGVYLIRVEGPGIKTTKRVLVVK